MSVQKGLKYAESHEWVLLNEDGTALVGLSDYAQNHLGDLVFINLPDEDDELEAGEVFADVESVKAVSDVNSPVTGKVIEINEEVSDEPELINKDPYGSWLVKVEGAELGEDLMDAEAYEAFIADLD